MPNTEDIIRECAALMKVPCPLCHAPADYHCASHINTIVWPPHLCRMDAYTHRLDPSEDWPMVLAEAPTSLQYVESKQPAQLVLWKTMVNLQLLLTHGKTHSIIQEE